MKRRAVRDTASRVFIYIGRKSPNLEDCLPAYCARPRVVAREGDVWVRILPASQGFNAGLVRLRMSEARGKIELAPTFIDHDRHGVGEVDAAARGGQGNIQPFGRFK